MFRNDLSRVVYIIKNAFTHRFNSIRIIYRVTNSYDFSVRVTNLNEFSSKTLANLPFFLHFNLMYKGSEKSQFFKKVNFSRIYSLQVSHIIVRLLSHRLSDNIVSNKDIEFKHIPLDFIPFYFTKETLVFNRQCRQKL